MPTLSERLMKVALFGVVPANDQSVIADANAELARLEEANGLIARADAAKEEEIERLRAANQHLRMAIDTITKVLDALRELSDEQDGGK